MGKAHVKEDVPWGNSGPVPPAPIAALEGITEEDIAGIYNVWASLSDCQQLDLISKHGNTIHTLGAWQRFLKELGVQRRSINKEKRCGEKVILKRGRKPSQLSLLAPYPTDMTRCSPFFPSPLRERKNVTFTVENSWGTLTYKGPRLTTAHEDFLMCILAAVYDKNKRVEEVVEVDGEHHQTTFIYTGSLRELLVARGNKNPNSADYDAAFNLLEDMSMAVFSYRRKGDIPPGQRKPRRGFNTMIWMGEQYDNGVFRVAVNPYFIDKILVGIGVTRFDVRLRMSMKSPYSKALHRFLTAQDKDWWGGLRTLGAVMNMPENFNNSELREKLRLAIDELIRLDILRKGSGVVGTQVVLLHAKKQSPKKPKPICIG